MLALLIAPAALQALAMIVDEGHFHRRRGLPRWERIGHPIDTLSVAACWGWTVAVAPDASGALAGFVALAAFSCLLVTKDEAVHARLASAGEHWLHAVQFVLHPIVFLGGALIWRGGDARWFLIGQLALSLGFATYQIVYWSLPWTRRSDG